jgi:Ca2+-transporting ATPase
MTPEEALGSQRSSLDRGLSFEEASARSSRFGRNELAEAERKSPLRILARQFADVMVVVLLCAAVVAGFLGEPQDIAAILAIVALNGVLGFVQEFRAERAIEALQAMSAPTARVRRGGRLLTVAAFELVPGDIVLLEAGNLVPADLRITEAHQLRINESALTGESAPVEKTDGPLPEENLPVADRKNMAFKGTLVANGRAVGLVTATGMQTELGKIASLLRQEVEVRTPLQERIARFARILALVVAALCVVFFVAGILRGEPATLMLLTAVSLAVAAIPEALPAVATVALSLGARRMARQNALIRKLPAVETLGSVTTICTDKTGTLTQNKMQVQAYWVDGKFALDVPAPDKRSETWKRLARMLALSNDAGLDETGKLRGDPTETAIYEAAARAGFERQALERRCPRVSEIPFSSERGMMTTIHRGTEAKHQVFVKGAPERVLPLCEHLDRVAAQNAIDTLAGKGFRVLAYAWRELPADPLIDLSQAERDLKFAGLIGLIDPPRPEARQAVAEAHSAGIDVVMITGDHPSTARAIARDLGIITRRRSQVMTGKELQELSAEELAKRGPSTAVFARAAPEQKIRIVKTMQEAGQVVSMTGDGVNDAPALKRSSIGVAMGKSGTDVAREAAHMVLLDDDFSTIVSAVREGRRIYDNIRKFIRFALTGNSGEIWTIFLAPFLGLPVPLLPIHILWVNLVTDGLPGLALAAEPAEAEIMDRPPRKPDESIFAHGLWQHTLWVGMLTAAITLGVQAWALNTGHAHWQSMTFTVLTLIQMGHVLAIRSESASLFRLGLFSNLPLAGSIALTFALQLATLYVPTLNSVFKTEPLSVPELGICLLASSTVFVAVEIEKLARRTL